MTDKHSAGEQTKQSSPTFYIWGAWKRWFTEVYGK